MKTELKITAQVLFIIIAAVGVYAFVHSARNDHRRASCTAICAMVPNYAGRNRIAPDFELKDMNGNMVSLSSFRGKTVVLNFWTRTCPPCLEEMPSLAELAKLGEKSGDFVVVTVSTDEGPEDVRDELAVALDEEPTFTILFDPESEVVLDQYGTKLFPETWIIDPDGIIRARFDGPRNWSSALAVEIAEMASQSDAGCLVEFDKGKPVGPFASICDDES